MNKDLLKGLSEEQIEKIKACKDSAELLSLAKAEGIELSDEYCMLAEKRLELAESDRSIQGYSGGVFWERNTAALQKKWENAQNPTNIFIS